MGKVKTIVVVGGGYAGINLLKALKKEFHKDQWRSLRVIMIDKNTFHFKKVKLFKGIVDEQISGLHVPLSRYCGSEIEFIQGELTAVNQNEQSIEVKRKDGSFLTIEFDRLVLALGSVPREVDSNRGGISLTSLETAQFIRHLLLEQLNSPRGQLRLVIVGSGVTGIETATEIGTWLKRESKKAGISSKNLEIVLINDKKRILTEVPLKISEKLEGRLQQQEITILHNKIVEKFMEGRIIFADHTEREADVCVWTVGLKPHPSINGLGLSLNAEGKIIVDSHYRLSGSESIYAIGDCIHVVDPASGKAAGMSCKEAIAQSVRLAKSMKAQMGGHEGTPHQTYPDLLCIGLGPDDGFVWTQKWGLDFVLSGKIAEKIREYTWNIASINQ